MSNATKTLLALFVVLLVITGIVKLSGNGNASKGLSTPIIKLDSSKVTRVKIKTAKHGPVTLFKKKKVWYVKGNSGPAYKAKMDLVSGALNRFTDLMPNAIITRNKNSFRRYEVDTTGTIVNFFNGKKKIGGIILGRAQYEGRRNMNTYVRPENKQVVYAVNGMLTPRFNQPVDNWRNKRVWNLSYKKVKQLNLVYPADSSYSIMHAGKNLWMYGSDSLKTSTATYMIRKACNLKADGFYHKIKPANFGKPLYKVQVKMNNGVVNTIKIKPDPDSKDDYIATASNYPYVFTENKSNMNSELLRPKKYVLKATKKKKRVKRRKIKK